jgi:hypothetical protein
MTNQPLTRSEGVVRSIQKNYQDCHAGKQEGHEVMLLVATPFGTHRVFSLFAYSDQLLLMNIQTGGEHPDILYCPVEQAAFLIQHKKPKNDDPRVIVGFGVHLAESASKE